MTEHRGLSFTCQGCYRHHRGESTPIIVGDLKWLMCADCATFLVKVFSTPGRLAGEVLTREVAKTS